MTTRMRFYHLVLLLALFGLSKSEEQTCSWTSEEVDPALQEMTYDVGDGEQTFMAYVQPDVSSFYREEKGSRTKVAPKFNGLAAKFINLSNKNTMHYWEASPGGDSVLMRYYKPFSSGGTASFPGHRFYMTPENSDKRLVEWVVEDYEETGQNLYVYDPYLVEGDPKQTEQNLKSLSKHERSLYDKWRKTLSFNEQYKNFTGRSYLVNYLRAPPKNFMWRADYFGQEHWVTTQETHFDQVPPSELLKKINTAPQDRVLKDSDPRHLSEYRVKDQPIMNMTLKVLSCAPRVFEIENYLSQAEIDHILDIAGGITLHKSTTGDVGSDGSNRNVRSEDKTKTRTSLNSWVPREESPILDAIYRRSADLLRMDESLLRYRAPNERPDLPTKSQTCESLQLVHYDKRQEYTAHHDFGYSAIDDEQAGARFATILFYLNDGMKGGETSFPRWVNAEVRSQGGIVFVYFPTCFRHLTRASFDFSNRHSMS